MFKLLIPLFVIVFSFDLFFFNSASFAFDNVILECKLKKINRNESYYDGDEVKPSKISSVFIISVTKTGCSFPSSSGTGFTKNWGKVIVNDSYITCLQEQGHNKKHQDYSIINQYEINRYSGKLKHLYVSQLLFKNDTQGIRFTNDGKMEMYEHPPKDTLALQIKELEYNCEKSKKKF